MCMRTYMYIYIYIYIYIHIYPTLPGCHTAARRKCAHEGFLTSRFGKGGCSGNSV